MKAPQLLLLVLFLPVCRPAGLPAQEDDGIPTRNLAEIGTGPALLVGIGDYDRSGSVFEPLLGIRKDLELMEATVRFLGWNDVTVLPDPTLGNLQEAVDAFGAKVRNSRGTSLFYFSGHGVLQDNKNYMIPARAKVSARGHLETYALPVEHVLGYLGEAGTGPALVFVDACRNNALPASSKSGGRDLLLARRAGVFVGFATAEGEVSNMSERGSIYTRSLARRLRTPGRDLDAIYYGIIDDVEKQSLDLKVAIQPPEKQSALRFALHLVPASRKAPLPSAPAPAQPPPGPFTNSLGMKFVPVPGTKVLMSVWETRVGDYRAFRKETGGEEDHPVVEVSWEDARAFAEWLGGKEGKTYRLPTDHEWSVAVGIGDRESATARPEEKDGEIEGVYPWGTQWPPPQGAGNYAPSLACDRFDETAPVGSFAPNRLGLYDLGGNVWEWCEDLYASSTTLRVLRGGSWVSDAEDFLRSSNRYNGGYPTRRNDSNGFRLVLEVASGG